MLKIGIMGGTFNPVHNGHLIAAKAARDQYKLDKILFITGGNPPHKKGQPVLDATARHKMVSLAIAGEDKFEACDYEIKKETYSYTFETLKYLKNQYKDSNLYFIVGADSFHDIPTWYKPRAIMELCTLLVYERNGYDRQTDFENIKKEYYCKVEFINSARVDISSSQIRELVSKGEEIAEYVPSVVADYISRNGLYRKNEESIKKRLKKALNQERYLHSIGVSATATALAKKYKVDENQAYIAGLLHDCAKNFDKEQMLKKCDDYDVELDEFEKENPVLIHAKVGEKVAAIEYGVRDREVLSAIKWHTLGYVGMGLLEKIILVADMIEPGRRYPEIENLRKLAFEDIDRAVLECMNQTIKFNTAKGRSVHPNAYEIIKWLM